MKLKITALSLCLFVLADFAMAQQSTTPPESSGSSTSSSNYGLPRKKDFDQWSIGIGGGVNLFQGDMQPKTYNNFNLKNTVDNLVLGLKIGYQMTHSVQINMRGYYAKLAGNEDDIRMRFPDAVGGKEYNVYGASFESPVYQGTLNFNYTLGNISFVQRNKRFHIFGEVGAGIFAFAPTVKGTIPEISTMPDSLLLERDAIAEGMLALSLGFKYQIKRIDIGLLYTFNKTLTDKIDWAHDAKTATDNYSFLTLNLNYTFGKKQAMMEWVNPMEVVYNDMAELKDKMDIISGDKDKDGVSDMFDKDNSTAEGTKVYGDGTAVDSDGDGVPDSKDSDPFSQKGAKVDASGVETDSDGDGVPDSRDLEPNTPKGSLTNFQGIAIEKAGASSSSVGWLPAIFFDLNKTGVRANQQDRALIVAKILMNNPDLKLNIIGNTDPTAGEDYNQKLGQRRADSVKDHLVKTYGIDAARLSTSSKGEKEQIAKKLNPMNRRVDFEVQK